MANLNLSLTDNYDALLSSTLRNYSKTLQNQIFRKLPLYYVLTQNGRKRVTDGGYDIIIPVLYGENTTVQAYSGYDTFNVTPQEGITSARYDWNQFAVSISISGLEERKNSGDRQIFNLLRAKTDQAERSLQWLLSDLLHGIHGGGYSGTGGKTFGESQNTIDSLGGTNFITSPSALLGFNSLDHLVRTRNGYMAATALSRDHWVGNLKVNFTTSDSAYTLSSYTNPWWVNYSIPGLLRLKRGGIPGANTSTTENGYVSDITGPLSGYGQNLVAAMRTLYNRLSDGAEHPDLILTSQEVYDVYEGALMPLERYTDTKLGDAGFSNLKFKNMTMMFDHGITTALSASGNPVPLYMLNTDYLEWVVDKERDFMTTPFMRPENQDARTAQILLMCNLTTNARNRHGVLACNGTISA